MSQKLPWMKFCPTDWLTDPHVTALSAASRGIWIDLIACMHNDGSTGVLSGTTESLARMARCTSQELKTAIADFAAHGTCDINERVMNDRGYFTLTCRRMIREAGEKKKEEKEETASSASSSFDLFWSLYPRKVGKGAAMQSYKRQHCDRIFEQIKLAIEQQATSKQWQSGYIPNPATWLNQMRWKDELNSGSVSISTPLRNSPTAKQRFDAALRDCVDRLIQIAKTQGTQDDIDRCVTALKNKYFDILAISENGGKRFLIKDAQEIAHRQLGISTEDSLVHNTRING